MKILKTYTRIYTNQFEATLAYYERLVAAKYDLRFSYQEVGLEIASVGDFLILAGTDNALRLFRDTQATCLVDSLTEFETFLKANGAEIIRGLKQVPTGKNMTVKHPDGAIIEYVEHI